jgi:hypothetical protein
MVYFILVWAGLIISSYTSGLLVINHLSPESFDRWGDRTIASVWLGILILASSLLATSLIFPLYPGVGLAVAAIIVVLSLVSYQSRRAIAQFRARLSPQMLFGVSILAVVVALLTTHQVTWIESGFYHYGAIRWLSEFGTVPGLVLLLANFGIVSSWFAVNAPLNGSIIDFQAGAIANSWIFLLTLLHTVICLSHLISHQRRLSDYFAISFYTLFWLYAAISGEMQLILESPSPDLPVILLIAMVGWSILVTTESRAISFQLKTGIEQTDLQNLDLTGNFEPRIMFNGSIVPLLLAAGAVTIKLSALPLLLVTGIFYAFETKFKLKQLLWGAFLSGAILLPMVLVGLQTSGCPLYPSPLFCLDVPWSQSLADTQKFADRTQNPATWVGSAPDRQNSLLWVFGKWLKSKVLNQVMAGLVVISLLCLIYLKKAIFKRDYGILGLSAIGVSGILFIIFKGPLIRFGLGYLLVLPALSIAVYSEKKHFPIFQAQSIYRKMLGKWHQIQAVTLGILVTIVLLSFGVGNLSSRWLLPPKVSAIAPISKQVNDVKYVTPQKGPCWTSPLPCTAKKSTPQVKLRNPILGIKAGFVRG